MLGAALEREKTVNTILIAIGDGPSYYYSTLSHMRQRECGYS